ncbi:MAG TPA: Spy/CpxP family protein refolding chaperone [Planctomycetota bacterium]|nr:Spy/CpxP family protein refolding chaperone [Planctomycetota bacterium]
MSKNLALIACAIVVAGGISFAAVQHGQRPGEGRQDRPGRLERDAGGRHARLGERVRRGRELIRSLGVTEQQKEQERGVAKALKPIADEVRPQARFLIQQARELARSGDRAAARELLRTQLRPMLAQAMERARPLVQPLVGTLTPEQRAKLEAAAAAHGRTFDQDRFTRRLAMRLARRGAQR